MENITLDQYKHRVNQLGQTLLDVIASVTVGDLNVDIDIPEDIEVFADLGIGLEFLIEDLNELAKEQETARFELEQRVAQRTRELQATLRDLQEAQRLLLQEGWQEYTDQEGNRFLARRSDQEIEDEDLWLPGMDKAVQLGQPTHRTNGENTDILSLPIQVQDEIIGVLGFNRKNNQPWTDQEVNTVEAIVEQVGLALENQRLFDRTQSALAEADTLYQASAELNLADTYEDTLKAVQKYTHLGATSFALSINLFDTPASKHQLPSTAEVIATLTQGKQEIKTELPISKTLFEQLNLGPEDITVIEDVNIDMRLTDQDRAFFTETLHARAAAIIPMVVGGLWIGFLMAAYEEPAYFSEDHFRRTRAISTQASVAVQNLRSIDLAQQRASEAQKRSEELALINRVVSAVSESTELAESLEVVANELNRAIPVVDETAIALLNQSSTELEIVAVAAKIKGTGTPVGIRMPLADNPAAQQAVTTKKPAIFKDLQTATDTGAFHGTEEEKQVGSLTIFPLVTGDEVIGTIAMAIANPRAEMSAEDIRLAETIVLQASTAIQNSRLLEQTQTALTETANLYQASAELNTIQSGEDILNVLRQYTILGASENFVSVAVFDDQRGRDNVPDTITFAAQWSPTGQKPVEDTPQMLTDWITEQDVFVRDQLVIVNDLATTTRLNPTLRYIFHEEIGAETLLAAPLLTAGRWIGHIFAAYDTSVSFSEDETRRLMALAGQAAVALQNLRLIDETTRRAGQLETAADIARQASSTLDLDVLLNQAVNLIRDNFGFYHASIFLLEGSWAVVRASTGEAGRQMIESEHRLLMDDQRTSIIGHVTWTGEPLVVNDVTQDPTHRPHPLLLETRGELGIPLKIGNRVTGALDVQSTKANAFSDDEIAVLRTLADQIAVAVDNARSFEVAQQAVEEIREADRLKTEFLANMSHELRTPLNSIIGFSRVILKGIDGPINEIQQQDLEAIHNSGQHLLEMINDILDLSKIEAGKMELSIEEIDLSEVIESVLSTAKGLLKEKELRLYDEIPDTLPTVHADRTRVRQIMINLLQNSIKFTEEGSITISTTLIDDEEGNAAFARIEVIDTGIGISEEDQNKLFERFSQVDSSLTRKVGGTGLGLSITQALVDMQGGEIGVESVEGEGSTFWFTLPVAREQEIVEEQIEDIQPGDKVIMAIDDDEKVINLYRRYLAAHGFKVIALTNPLEALNQVKEVNPFAITLDIMMPGKDGWQVIEDIKSDPATQNIPIIICSIVEDRERGINLGANDYLVKPILEDEFVKAIKGLNLNSGKETHTILVVDDDPNVLQLVKKTSQHIATLEFTYAQGGLLGLESIKNNPPDAVILDLMMPDLDGFSVLETMQKDPQMKDIPVIILTGADLTEEQLAQVQEYKRDLISKDMFQEEQLAQCLERALQNLEDPD